MEAKLLAVLTAGLSGVSVSGLCRELGISRQTFYKYRRRFEVEGPAGLVERSRRPARSPGLIPAELEDEIVRLRKDRRVDHGAQQIAFALAAAGWEVPAVSTIHRALVRRGLVMAEPKKRPKAATRRFEWARPNDAWQIDATRWALRSGRSVWIMDLVDDHSRVALAAQACSGPTGDAAWAAFCAATERWGLPAHVMSDNGSCFTGRFHDGHEVLFERSLRALGVRHICSAPAHPQTCGKLERFHQTLKRHLATVPRARTRRDLQRQLDEYLEHYNHQRAHSAAAGNVPASKWAATPPAQPGAPIPEPAIATVHTVSDNGILAWSNYRVGVGVAYRGQQLVVIAHGDDLAVFAHHGLVRRLRLDRTRNYQPTGLPAGRPRTHT